MRSWSYSKTMKAHTSKLVSASGYVTSLTCRAGFMNLKHPKVDAMSTFACFTNYTALRIIYNSLTCCLLHAGPYTNVLDLYLFPFMSHRHSAHLQRQSSSELSLDRIWETVACVWIWKDTVSVEVARLCILSPYP